MFPNSPPLLVNREELLCLEDCLEILQALELAVHPNHALWCARIRLRLLWLIQRQPLSASQSDLYHRQARLLRQSLTLDRELSPSHGAIHSLNLSESSSQD